MEDKHENIMPDIYDKLIMLDEYCPSDLYQKLLFYKSSFIICVNDNDNCSIICKITQRNKLVSTVM